MRFDHRVFPLELANERPTPKRVLDAEVPVVGAAEPDAGWQMWQAPDSRWPVTTLLALEAVQVAKEQGSGAERATRPRVAAGVLRREPLRVHAPRHPRRREKLRRRSTWRRWPPLSTPAGRRIVVDQHREAEAGPVKGSPHVFLPDGSDHHNPGIRMHWEGEHGRGFPVIDEDDPSV